LTRIVWIFSVVAHIQPTFTDFKIYKMLFYRTPLKSCFYFCRRSRLAIVIVLLLIFPLHSFSQESKDVPDGTKGEFFKSEGGGFLYQYAGYIQDSASKEQFDLKPEFKVRDFHVTTAGRFKFKKREA